MKGCKPEPGRLWTRFPVTSVLCFSVVEPERCVCLMQEDHLLKLIGWGKFLHQSPSHSKDSPSESTYLTGQRSLIWHGIPLTRIKHRPWCPVSTHFQIWMSRWSAGPSPTLHLQFCRLHSPCMPVEMQHISLLPTSVKCRFHLLGLWKLMYCPLVLYCRDIRLPPQKTAFQQQCTWCCNGTFPICHSPLGSKHIKSRWILQPPANFLNAFPQNATPLLASSSVSGPQLKNRLQLPDDADNPDETVGTRWRTEYGQVVIATTVDDVHSYSTPSVHYI